MYVRNPQSLLFVANYLSKYVFMRQFISCILSVVEIAKLCALRKPQRFSPSSIFNAKAYIYV